MCNELVAHALQVGGRYTYMLQPLNPRQFVLTHLQQLRSAWPGVQDADVESVHDARVATRRIRAALPFVFDAPQPVAKELRRIGRALGRVRELDATDALLGSNRKRRTRPTRSACCAAICMGGSIANGGG